MCPHYSTLLSFTLKVSTTLTAELGFYLWRNYEGRGNQANMRRWTATRDDTAREWSR